MDGVENSLRPPLVHGVWLTVVVALLIPSTILAWRLGSGQGPRTFDPSKYLPSGSKLKDTSKDVVFADLLGDGAREAVIFYTVGESSNDHQANILVLRPHGSGYQRFWENSFEGSWGFDAPTGVYDLNKTGRPQIVVYRTIGASCPGVLEIYEYFKGRIQRITGAWADNGQCQSVKIEDLDGNGVPEIIVRSRNYGVNQDIYRWTGRKYDLSNARFPQYYNPELKKLLKGFEAPQVLPASGRLQLASQIVGIFIIQRRFTEAVAFCRRLLEILKNPALTEADRPQGQSTAAVYRLLGDTYKAASNREKAKRYYRRADELTGTDQAPMPSRWCSINGYTSAAAFFPKMQSM
jgi:hypothetical protein